MSDRSVDHSLLNLQVGNRTGRAGGVDRYFDGLLRFWHQTGVNVQGFVFDYDQPEPVPSNVHVAAKQTQKLQVRHRLLRQGIKSAIQQQPSKQVVIASHFALYTLPLIKIARRHRFPVVSHFHGPWADESAHEGASNFNVLMKRMLERYVYRRSDLVLAVSSSFMNLAVERYAVSAKKAKYIPAGIEAEPFLAMKDVTKEAARQRMGWPHDKKIVLAVRRLARRMGLDRLIEAFQSIARHDPNVHLMIGGKGAMHEALQQQIEAAGLCDRITLAGFISEENLPYAYRAADLGIVPSISLEGFGLIALESLASGTPVVVTPIGGLPEVVRSLDQRLILEGTEVEQLKSGLQNSLQALSTFPDLNACQQYVQDNFTWSTIAPRLMQEYKELLK